MAIRGFTFEEIAWPYIEGCVSLLWWDPYQMKFPPFGNRDGMSEGISNLRCHRAAPELFQPYFGCDTASPSNERA